MQIRHPSAERCPVRTSTIKTRLTKALCVFFWLAVWQTAAAVVGQRILIVGPVEVVIRLFELLGEPGLWSSSVFSTARIAGGFLLALASAIVLSMLASVYQAFKAIPVASIVIVVLIWVDSRNLSVIISFMMVFPVLYTNLLSAIESTDSRMVEMGVSYRLGAYEKLRLIYLPQVYPYFLSSSSLALGLAWKSGVAAEVIGIPDGSLGERLYDAKVFFATADVFAYTLLIVILSVGFEVLMKSLIRYLGHRLEAV